MPCIRSNENAAARWIKSLFNNAHLPCQLLFTLILLKYTKGEMSNRILFLASAAYSFAKQRQVYSDTRLMVTPFLSIKIYEVTLHFEKCYFNLLGCICNGFCLCPKDTLDLKSNAFDLCSQSFLFKRNGIITITPHCIHGRPPPSPPSIQALTNRPQLRLTVWCVVPPLP